MYMGEIAQTKTDAVANLLTAYFPQLSPVVEVVAGTQQKTAAPAVQKPVAAKPAFDMTKAAMWAGGGLLAVGLIVALVRRSQ